MNLEKPFEEYSKHEAEVFVGTKPVKKTKMKCFLWLPKNVAEEPHFYLFIEDFEEYKVFQQLIKKNLHILNLNIEVTTLDGAPYQHHIIKKAHFSNAKATLISKNWHETFIKYHFPKYVLTKTSTENNQENKFLFFISESELLSSDVTAVQHYTGEIKRKVVSKISIKKEVSHLGIKSIKTDKYIGIQKSNILEIIPNYPVKSLLSFYKNIKPIVDLILLLTSFAERRRLNWHKCDGMIATKYIENYHTRVTFHQDKKTTFLISRFEFEKFLKNSLRNIEFKNVKYITQLLRSYFSGMDYSANAQIILWNSILEKILKNKFEKKRDDVKADLLQQMYIYTADLVSIKDLINIRNDIAHGDDIKSDRLFQLVKQWQILIERVLLHELSWNDLSKTDVGINGIKPYALY